MMDWHEKINPWLQALSPVTVDVALQERCIRLVDLTSLHATDTESSVAIVCQKAHTSFGDVAGVCVYPAFIGLVADQFRGTDIRAVTVVNFPEGTTALEEVLVDINKALEDGANEIDMVFPYQQFIAGHRREAIEFVKACRAACGDNITLKVIIESGALHDFKLIAEISQAAIDGGCDFIKTSTGKGAQGATIEAAAVILAVIQKAKNNVTRSIGLKVSGGIASWKIAAEFVQLAEHVMGDQWIHPDTFRIGTSRLVD